VLAVVAVVNSLTLMHYQCTDLAFSFVDNFLYWLTCESLFFAKFSAVVMGVGLYVGQLTREYIQ